MKGSRLGSGIGVALILAGLLIAAVSAGLATPPARGEERRGTAPRFGEPVIVAGDALSLFLGAPVTRLAALAFDGSDWTAVPFQIDQRTNDMTATYVITDDDGFLFDANDELVFMSHDAGGPAGEVWPPDTAARLGGRHVIELVDPLNGGMATLYLYDSATLPRSGSSYVTWDEGAQRVTAVSYTAEFGGNEPTPFIGLANLEVNGNGVDVVDRQKARVCITVIFPCALELNEEDLATQVTPTVQLAVVGPVRGVSGASLLSVAVYGHSFATDVLFDLGDVGAPDSIRISLDLNDPVLTGFDRYYDSNLPAGVPIDGTPDAVPGMPVAAWTQVSGATGGLVTVLPVVGGGGGTVSNFYEDDATATGGDTGDGRSFGESGIFVATPGNIVTLQSTSYILPPGATGSVGAAYAARVDQPLVVTADFERFSEGTALLPVILRP